MDEAGGFSVEISNDRNLGLEEVEVRGVIDVEEVLCISDQLLYQLDVCSLTRDSNFCPF